MTVAFAAKEPALVGGDKKTFGYSWQQELKLGADSDKEITEQMGIYNDPNLQGYVEAVGRRVLENSDFNSPNAPEIYRNTKFTFRVLDTPVVNAFALPGGYVYVTRGLLTHVQNEAQLGVVLGHEIGHVAARHSSQQARRSQWTQLGVMAGAILGQKVLGERVPTIGQSVLQLGGKTAEVFLLRYSREAETEADTLGVNYALRSGYAAGESAHFFQSLQRLSTAEGKALPTWQSTHPDPGDRAQHVLQLASTVPPSAANNRGEDEYLRHIDGMIVGDDPREGFTRNGVFYHPTMHFQLPVANGWKIDNQRSAVVMAEPNGKAMMGLKVDSGTRARDAAAQFVSQAKVQVSASGDTMVNGLPTSVVMGQASTDEGNVGVWNAFIEYEGKVYSLLAYSPPQNFEQMRPTFESVAAGFGPLRDPSLASIQPAKLRLVRADTTAPFASFVPTALPPEVTPEQMAILNQVSLNDQVPEGRVLKVPVQEAAPAVPVSAPAPMAYPAAPPPQSYPTYTYPPQNYPSPATAYPQPPPSAPQAVPPQTTYPAQGYPGRPYPGRPYPASNPGYPPAVSGPQFPQPGGATTSTPAPANPQPNWPR